MSAARYLRALKDYCPLVSRVFREMAKSEVTIFIIWDPKMLQTPEEGIRNQRIGPVAFSYSAEHLKRTIIDEVIVSDR